MTIVTSAIRMRSSSSATATSARVRNKVPRLTGSDSVNPAVPWAASRDRPPMPSSTARITQIF